jgi:hypothetical protein
MRQRRIRPWPQGPLWPWPLVALVLVAILSAEVGPMAGAAAVVAIASFVVGVVAGASAPPFNWVAEDRGAVAGGTRAVGDEGGKDDQGAVPEDRPIDGLGSGPDSGDQGPRLTTTGVNDARRSDVIEPPPIVEAGPEAPPSDLAPASDEFQPPGATAATVTSLRRANLTGAYLRGADLRGADLRGACLDGADLQGARMDQALLGPPVD